VTFGIAALAIVAAAALIAALLWLPKRARS